MAASVPRKDKRPERQVAGAALGADLAAVTRRLARHYRPGPVALPRSCPGGSPAAWAARGGPCRDAAAGDYAVTACFWSLLVIWMLRGLAASWTGMVRVSTPAA